MARTISELRDKATYLAGLVGGIDVLTHYCSFEVSNDEERKAVSALTPMLREAVRYANELSNNLDELDELDAVASTTGTQPSPSLLNY
ncbi:hypothetical protein [Pseudooceanicola sp.]|uniref:hypothetical protein n=1 Tax=Pseudooceanicola sp. TaxID=1914328 RepID=UPI003518AE8F